jgi:hypothetical protein
VHLIVRLAHGSDIEPADRYLCLSFHLECHQRSFVRDRANWLDAATVDLLTGRRYDVRMAVATKSQPLQRVNFCHAPDGVRIAYAVHGRGPALLISTCWLSHLQFDWQSPVWRHFLVDLGEFATVIRFDERGHGLSDWDVADHSFEARLGDLEAVADAAGFPKFALMGMAQGGPVSIAYAVRHPERVTSLLSSR